MMGDFRVNNQRPQPLLQRDQSEMTLKSKRILIWTLRIVFGMLFLLAGLPKLVGVAAVLERFSEWGYPTQFAYVIGLVEVIAGIGLIVNRTVRYGALLLLAVMAGALFTHALAGEWGRFPIVAIFVIALWAIYYFVPSLDSSSHS